MDGLVRDRETPAAAAGLSDAEARQRLAQDGPNELPVSQPRSVLRLAREVACEPMFLLLVACGAIYMLLGDRQEALMLLGFVFVVMGISFVQQRRSERSLDRCISRPVTWWWATGSCSQRATGCRPTCNWSRSRISLSMNRC
jgi:magnesium-transporting ATPase (P-type)